MFRQHSLDLRNKSNHEIVLYKVKYQSSYVGPISRRRLQSESEVR